MAAQNGLKTQTNTPVLVPLAGAGLGQVGAEVLSLLAKYASHFLASPPRPAPLRNGHQRWLPPWMVGGARPGQAKTAAAELHYFGKSSGIWPQSTN